MLSVHREAERHTITDYSLYMFVLMRLCCSQCDGAISRLTVFSKALRHWSTLVRSRQNAHTNVQHTHFISLAPTSNLRLASGNTWERLAFLTFIITRKRATKWTKKTKTKGGNQKKCFYQGPSVQGLTHTRTLRHTHTHALPVPDPHVTPITFQHLKMQSRRLFSQWSLSVCVCVRAFLVGYRHHHLTRII